MSKHHIIRWPQKDRKMQRRGREAAHTARELPQSISLRLAQPHWFLHSFLYNTSVTMDGPETASSFYQLGFLERWPRVEHHFQGLLKDKNWGWRDGSGLVASLLLQRTQVWFPAHTGQLTSNCNSGSGNPMPSSVLSEHLAGTRST